MLKDEGACLNEGSLSFTPVSDQYFLHNSNPLYDS